MCHGRDLAMRDANGVRAETPLFPLRIRLYSLMTSKSVHFSNLGRHMFLDRRGLLDGARDIAFLKAHDEAVKGFVHHCRQLYTEQPIRMTVARAEAVYLQMRVNAMEEAQ